MPRSVRVARIRSIDHRDYYLGGIKLDLVDVEKDLGNIPSAHACVNVQPLRYLQY